MLLDRKLRASNQIARAPRRSQRCTPHQLRHIATCNLSLTARQISRFCTSPRETGQQVLVETSDADPCYAPHFSDDEDGEGLRAGPGPCSRATSHVVPEVSFVSLEDGKYTVRGRLLLPVSATRVFSLLTDYAGCHRVFANIAASEVRQLDDGSLQVVQSCRWKFLAFSGTFRVHLGVQEDLNSRTLLFNLVQSSFMRDFEGRWAVRPVPALTEAAGESTSSWCEVEHQLSIVPSMPVPPPVSFYTRSIFVRQVEGILTDLQAAVLADKQPDLEEARLQKLAATTVLS